MSCAYKNPVCTDILCVMKLSLALASAISVLALGAAHSAAAAPPGQDAEDAAESAWETYVSSTATSAAPGTLSCALLDGPADGDAAFIAICFALTTGNDGSFDSVIVGRSTSTDGLTWAEFEPLPLAAVAQDNAVASPAEGGFQMPDATGMDLQAAQDLLQDASGDMLYFSSSEDATGEGRMQLIDSNWVVCSQNVGPAETVTDDLNVIFYVVKDDEACP
jgi:hypothetical protein